MLVGFSPERSKGSMSEILSIRVNNSEAAVAALVKVTIFGATEFSIAAAMITEKSTLNYVSMSQGGILRQRLT